jgi:phenylacetate-CoA ligase
MFYNEEFETLPRPALEALQLKRLKGMLERVHANVPFYKELFARNGVTPDKVVSLQDLRRLPFTIKQDMRDAYPYGLFSAPMEDIVRIHASSGTTGRPTVVGYTQKDIDTWTELMARSFVAAGVHRGDIIHNAYGYGLFTGGLGAHYGAEKLGASVIPMSGGNTKRQILIMKDFGSSVLTCTPSYSLYLAESALEEGVEAACRYFWSRTLVRVDAERDRSKTEPERHRYLWSFRDHGTGSCYRVSGGQARAPYLGRPLHSRNHQSGNR